MKRRRRFGPDRSGQWRQLTKNNAALTPTWGKAESLEWTNEGLNIQGWLLPPRASGVRQEISNGRSDPWRPFQRSHAGVARFFGMSRAIVAALSSRGYYVLLPNPRGSYGQGEDFTRANVKDFGGGDLRDILAGVDAAIAKYPIDPARLGVTGWSYGGYMTMWTVTQTNRFRAAVAGAGIANWQSYYGQNLIDQWMIPFFGASVYDDPGCLREEFADSVSSRRSRRPLSSSSANAMPNVPRPNPTNSGMP